MYSPHAGRYEQLVELVADPAVVHRLSEFVVKHEFPVINTFDALLAENIAANHRR